MTDKTAAKAINKLNGAKQLHDSLYHQDVVGLEQEYEDKCTQFNEREAKIAKVVPAIKARGIKVDPPTYDQCTPNYTVSDTPPSVVPEQCATSNEYDAPMYPAALEHLVKKLNQPYPHYKVFRKGTKYEYRTVQYELFGQEFIA